MTANMLRISRAIISYLFFDFYRGGPRFGVENDRFRCFVLRPSVRQLKPGSVKLRQLRHNTEWAEKEIG